MTVDGALRSFMEYVPDDLAHAVSNGPDSLDISETDDEAIESGL
jgi:hypothetical protein